MVDTFEAGEIIEAMRKSMFDQLETRIPEVREKTGWDEFWLIYTSREDMNFSNVIREGWVASPIKPQLIAGTLVFHIIWSKGLVEIVSGVARGQDSALIQMPPEYWKNKDFSRKI